MKRILFAIVAMVLMTTAASAQRSAKFWWFDAGAKIQYGVTGLYSKAIADSDNWNYEINTGIGYGVKLGLNKGSSGFTIDAMYSKGKQEFESATKNPSPDRAVEWTSFDLYTLYRNNRQLGYFEIGPKFAFLQDVTQSDVGGTNSFDATELYHKNNIAAVLGFGAYFLGDDGRFSGILGLRFEYGLQDLIKDNGHSLGSPVGDITLNKDEKAVPLFAGISFELNWGIGYYGKASCGGRSKFISF